MKKIIALFAVAALAAVGCDDKKTTGGKTTTGTGGTFVKTDTVRVDTTRTVTNTVLQGTDTVTKTNTVAVTKTVDKGKDGPNLKDPSK